jgi:hypothetical protein
MPLPLIPILAGVAIGGGAIGIAGMFGGGKKEASQDTYSTQDTYTYSDQYTTNYNITTDNSYNLISDSPFASLKKGDMGTLGGSPGMNVIPTVSAEQVPTIDQTSKTDMTGLLFIALILGVGVYAYKEVVN